MIQVLRGMHVDYCLHYGHFVITMMMMVIMMMNQSDAAHCSNDHTNLSDRRGLFETARL